MATGGAVLQVIAPSGQRERMPLYPLPFSIGRQGDNDLVLRDNRASRKHARIVFDAGDYIIEDLESRHGVWINGQRVHRQVLREADRVDIGLPDSYQLIFTRGKERFRKVLAHFSSFIRPEGRNTGDLAKLRSLVEVARALENSLSTEEVLGAVVDAALTVTACDRGFLFLRSADGAELEIAVGRDRAGRSLLIEDLAIQKAVLMAQLISRRELLSVPLPRDAGAANALCLPLIRVQSESGEETRATTAAEETVGMIYMDSLAAADLSAGNRELLETLAIEASTILENARLLEEQRAKIRMEDELRIAREIQRGLLPVSLPSAGWFRAAGSSRSSNEVGGDYYDVHSLTPDVWVAVLADVSGKGVSSALLASLLQGTFLMASGNPSHIEPRMARLNEFLLERTKGEKYATVFYCVMDRSGLFSYTNAAQCIPVLANTKGELRFLESTSMPVGMFAGAPFLMVQEQLAPGDKIVIYTDGVTEAVGAGGAFFGSERLKQVIRENAAQSANGLHAALMQAVERFIGLTDEMADEGNDVLADDVTALVIEYAG